MDIYSIAITINELITREQPFGPEYGYEQVRAMVLQGNRPRVAESCPYANPTTLELNLFKKLSWAVKAGWYQEWKERPEAETILGEL